MATLLPTLDKTSGVDAVYSKSMRFLSRYNQIVDFPVTKQEARVMVEEIWDSLGDFDYKSLITGSLQTSMPPEFVALLVYATAKVQFEQYVTTLPQPQVADISGAGQGDP
jgi:hypothetical protein